MAARSHWEKKTMFRVWGSRLSTLGAMLGLVLFAASAQADSCETDYNGDGVTNDVDAEIFMAALGSQEGDENYNVLADHDENGSVTATDYAYFLGCN